MTVVDQQYVLVERIGTVARLTLNRPESLNAINSDLATEFIDALDECSADEEMFAPSSSVAPAAPSVPGTTSVAIGRGNLGLPARFRIRSPAANDPVTGA